LPIVNRICEECGKEFQFRETQSTEGNGKYCSRECLYKALKNITGADHPNWKRIILICKECGKEFEVKPHEKDQRQYCSALCRSKAHRNKFVGDNHPRWVGENIKLICEQCEKEFEVRPWVNKKYCSNECKYEAMKIKFTGENNPSWNGGKIKSVCKNCGKEFEDDKRSLVLGTKKYCSKKCAYESSRGKFVKNKSPVWTGEDVEVICEQCGTIFLKGPNSKKRFCSKECKCEYIANSGMFVGDKSPLWKGGISFEPYCIKFNSGFKERVRAFFNYTCQTCGHVWRGGEKRLSVHHANFRKDSCCNEEAIPLFVPLCTSCHTKTNHNREYWEKYFTDLINNNHGGKCYFTKEEMRQRFEEVIGTGTK
jgi:hypothetical protein